MNNSINKQKTTYNRIVLFSMMFFFVLGFVFQTLYNLSPQSPIHTQSVEKAVNSNCQLADKDITIVNDIIKNNNIDSLKWLVFEKRPFTIAVFEKEKLIFWSNNHTILKKKSETNWRYELLPNMHSLVKAKNEGKYTIIAYLPLKYNFPYENEELQNVFLSGIDLNKNIDINDSKSEDKRHNIFSNNGKYLFSLHKPDKLIYSESLALTSFLFFVLAFILMFHLLARLPLLFGKEQLSVKEFMMATVVMLTLVLTLLTFNFPSTFFLNKIFTPYQYSSSRLLSTLTSLSFLSFFLFAESVLLYRSIRIEKEGSKKHALSIALLTLPILIYIVICKFFVGIVLNSTTDINILQIEDFSFVKTWNHFLFLIWALTQMISFFAIHKKVLKIISIKEMLIIDGVLILLTTIFIQIFFDKYVLNANIALLTFYTILYLPILFNKMIFGKRLFAIWLFVFTAIFVTNSILINNDKNFDRYKTLAQNHFIMENNGYYNITEGLLSDFGKRIEKDTTLRNILAATDSIEEANIYFEETYLKGFWNKYEARLFVAKNKTKLFQEYKETINKYGRNIDNSHFYKIKKDASNLIFLGKFPIKKGSFFVEFYAKKKIKSFSFPNLLKKSSSSFEPKSFLSTAKYHYRELESQQGQYNYPNKADWIKKSNADFFKQKGNNGQVHYIYAPDIYHYYIISEKEPNNFSHFFLYLIYTYLAYFIICFFVIWIYEIIFRIKSSRPKFVTKYLYSFIFLIVFGLIITLLFTTGYMGEKYKEQQLENIEQNKKYIQTHLQKKYSLEKSLDSIPTENLYSELQDLSYTYQTDIHIYDNRGRLITSSQPLLFSKNLIGKQISPTPYFSQNKSLNLYEKIGHLEYLTSYTEFHNGGLKHLGYIAVPFFLSEDKLKSDINQLLTVIIQIYLFIIIVLLLFSLFIANRLSKPLAILQENLKEMNLGKANKQIIYKPKDEIGLLVAQYNKTVEQLEKKTKLLMKSERETAWRTMAQQVAHEINNPLTPMKLTIQQLQRVKTNNPERFDEIFSNSAQTLIEQIENLKRISKAFSNFAKIPETRLTKVDIAEKLTSVVSLFNRNEQNVVLAYEGKKKDVFAQADGEQMVQVFNNLIKNAIQSIPLYQQGFVKIVLKQKKNKITISIQDNGKGISAENQKKLFEPNFTTKSTGMGLGLSICKNFIKNIGGKITFESEPNKGTIFKVVIPTTKK